MPLDLQINNISNIGSEIFFNTNKSSEHLKPVSVLNILYTNE